MTRFLPETATTPRLLKLLMWAPEMPMKAGVDLDPGHELGLFLGLADGRPTWRRG